MEGFKNISSFYDKYMLQCPIITSYEYDRFYFLAHKIYTSFYGDVLKENEKISFFQKNNLNKIIEYISQLKFDGMNDKNFMTDKFNQLAILETNNQFIEQTIREYTSETSFCYLFNRPLRNFGKGLISFSYFMGPFIYGLNKYVRDNPKFAMSKKMELYKIIKCSKLDFYNFALNLGHIICLTSLVSTSSSNIKYKQELDKEFQQRDDENSTIIVKLKFKYSNYDGKYISSHPNDKDVLLFPFTFAKIYEIVPDTENGTKIQIVKFEIINKKAYSEYLLQEDFLSRVLYSPLEQK